MNATIPSLKVEQAAYFAGLFDGEGYVTMDVKEGRRGGTSVLIVGLGSTDFSVLEDLRKTFGGCLTAIRLSSKSARKPSREWKHTNSGAVSFLKAIYPYLRIKKRQAALAFKLRKVMDQSLWSKDAHRIDLLKDLKEEIRSLNRSSDLETVKEASLYAAKKSQSIAPVVCNDRLAAGDGSL